MVRRATGRRKSDFVAQDTVPANSFMDYFVDNTNYRISYTNLVSGLGVTGTIVTTGSGTAAPVLEKDGTINKIRNIENGSGIAASISGTNGVSVKHNFTVDAVGLPIMLNTAAISPTFVSLFAGSGIELNASSNSIVINAKDALYGAQVTLQDNATATVISSTATPVLVAGTFVIGELDNYTGTTAGRIQYTNAAAITQTIHASMSIAPSTSGDNNQDLSLYIAKNGAVIATTEISAVVSYGAATNLCIITNVDIAQNDYFEMFVQNNSTTGNILVSRAIFGVD